MEDKEDSMLYIENYKVLIVSQIAFTTILLVLSVAILEQAKNSDISQARKAGSVAWSALSGTFSFLIQYYVIKNYRYLVKEELIKQTKVNQAFVASMSAALKVIVLFTEVLLWLWYFGYPSLFRFILSK